MSEFTAIRSIKADINKKVLNGAKTPHTTSFPVLRMENGILYLAFFVRLDSWENAKKKVINRPAYWYLADLRDGHIIESFDCREEDFCTAPWGRTYPAGVPAKQGTAEDILALYEQLDLIRKHYLEDGILDAFAYRDYREQLLALLRAGESNFYKELSKLR